MLEMRARSGEVNGQAVAERDQKISNLKKQLDKLKSENSKSEGKRTKHITFLHCSSDHIYSMTYCLISRLEPFLTMLEQFLEQFLEHILYYSALGCYLFCTGVTLIMC